MKKITQLWFRRFGLLLFLQLLFASFAFAQGFSPSVQNRLQYIIDSFQNNSATPFVGGMAVAINVDGLALWQGSTGYAARNIDAQNNLLPGGTPFTKDMLSRVYSVTKTFTAALVLELAKEGSLNLDAPVSIYIPLHLINPGLNSSVTIRQLLAHESGYSDYTDEYMLQVSVAFQPGRVWNAFETISFCHQINTPGAERRYSSTNYIMLGAIVEAATGKPIEQHYRERFFNKLGLASMYLGGRELQNNHGELASPHDNISMFNPVFQMTGQPTFPDAYTNITRFPLDAVVSLAFTGGGIVSNAADLANWGNALFGGRATSTSTIQIMLGSISSTPDEDGDYLGYGIWTNKRISATDYFVGHNGSAIGYRSLMMYQPDRKMTIALVTNYSGCDPYIIEKLLYEALPDFLCGNENRKEWKILLCYKGKDICVAREGAAAHIKKGAFLGSCGIQVSAARPEVSVNGRNQASEEVSFTAYPNPFSNQVAIQFKATKSGVASLNLYDLNGKLVKHLFTGNMQEGMMKQIMLPSNGLTAGTYICRLQIGEAVINRRLIVIK